MMPATSQKPVPAVVLNDTRVDLHHGCSRVMPTLEMLLQRSGCHITAFSPAHLDWRQDAQFMRAFEHAKLVIVNGEGSIHHDRIQGSWLLEAGARARLLDIPAVLLNCSWQDNGPELTSRLRDFALIAAREPRSAAEIKSAGFACKTVPDLSLYLPHMRPDVRQGIGFTDSVVRETALDLDHIRRKMNGRNLPIQFSGSGIGGALSFIFGPIGRKDLANPLFLVRMLNLRLGQLTAQAQSAEQYLDRIASLKLLITGRFHAMTFALLTETPFLAGATNSHKIVSLVEEIGLPDWRTHTVFSPSEIQRAADTGWETGELNLIKDYLEDGRAKTDVLFQDIQRLM